MEKILVVGATGSVGFEVAKLLADSNEPVKIAVRDPERAKSINFGEAQSTVGAILTATETSEYPNEIRYGDNLYHYPPSVMLDTAKAVNTWAKDNQGKFRIKNSPTT